MKRQLVTLFILIVIFSLLDNLISKSSFLNSLTLPTVNFWEILKNLLWAIVGGIIGSLIALKLDKYQEPDLQISVTEDAHSDNTYPSGHNNTGQRWKFYRVWVKNEPIPNFLSWVLNRRTAMQVNATIKFLELDKAMKGRWAGTLELVNADPSDYIRIINFPDPVTIFGGEREVLDIFTKYEHDSEAYGWNNEAYMHNWRTPSYEMPPGDYLIEVQAVAQNGSKAKKTFRAHIDQTIEETYIKESKDI